VTVGDTLGRQLRDLRISGTDRCNFRCVELFERKLRGVALQDLTPLKRYIQARLLRSPRLRSNAAY
jgi:molybdenum cofactor biosynthesis enzyme MoaA